MTIIADFVHGKTELLGNFRGKCSSGLLTTGQLYAAAGLQKNRNVGFPTSVGTQKIAKPPLHDHQERAVAAARL
jgi:hypothetical protein